MNFLAITQDIRLLSGAQGNGPISVEGTEGYEQALVTFAREAYISIQNLREDFRFLRSSYSGYTVIDQSDYTVEDKSITKGTIKISVDGKWVLLDHTEYRSAEVIHLNSTVGTPTTYAFTGANTIRLYPTPDRIYTLEMETQENPEILMTDGQVPKLPLSLHRLIVYKGLEGFSVFLGSPEIYRQYSAEASQLEQKLMALDVPQKTIKQPRFDI